MAAIFIPTRRTVRTNPFARLSLRVIVGSPNIRSPGEQPPDEKPFDKWPHLKAAWEIIHSNLNVPAPKARRITIESAIAAKDCVVALNYKSEQIARIHARRAVQSACLTISRCINRVPKALRTKLDLEIAPLIEESIIDTETIECIFKTASGAFGQYPDNEPSGTARRLIEPFDPALNDWNDPGISKYGAVRDYEVLDPAARFQAELALINLRNQRERARPITASAIFHALGEALGEEGPCRSLARRVGRCGLPLL
jgi:hypothetical protein